MTSFDELSADNLIRGPKTLYLSFKDMLIDLECLRDKDLGDDKWLSTLSLSLSSDEYIESVS